MTVALAELPKGTLPETKQAKVHGGHLIEADVRRKLLSTDGVSVSSLVVRRLPNGICLEGILNVSDQSIDICESLRDVEGVKEILNRMVVRTDQKPR